MGQKRKIEGKNREGDRDVTRERTIYLFVIPNIFNYYNIKRYP